MLNRPILNEALQAKPGCLTPQELEKLSGESSPSHPHLSQCPRCQSELALLKLFESSTPVPGEGAAVAWISARLEQRLDQIKNPGASRRASASRQTISWLSQLFGSGSARWLLPAAGALLVAVTSVLLMHRSQEPRLSADAGNGPVVYRSQQVEVTGPSGDVSEAPKTLHWKAFGGATEYKVSIMEVDEVPLWSGETRELMLTIPSATRARMLPGKPVLWRVTALDSQGQVLAVSQVQRFSVQRNPPGSTSGTLPR